jgi:hypothetical protein
MTITFPVMGTYRLQKHMSNIFDFETREKEKEKCFRGLWRCWEYAVR